MVRPRLVAASLLAVLLTACSSREELGRGALTILGEGVVNNPANKSLRFDILEFGLDRFCFEMLRLGAPLKLSDDQPVLGRFFAETCQSQVLDDSRKSFVVQYSGKGYGWTNLSGRLGFTSSGLIEYAPDFQMHEGAMYIYFRPRNIDATRFNTLMVESSFAKAGMAVTGLNPDQLGRNLVQGQLQRGFTVIRYASSGETDFGLGYVQKGRKPFKPFSVQHSDKVTLANDRTEVHTGQQDFVGGFEVKEDDQALYLTLSADGAPAVDVLLLGKGAGDVMIDQYVKNPGPTSTAFTPALDEALTAGQLWKRYARVPKGVYYLLIDHSDRVGRSAPSAPASDDRAAKVDYLVQLGAAP
ncbi:MAG TPA: hypothetical protein VK524_12900 [Polyangiaceae bacterium]|nr:hypothetical protein [Polyangiaceae bacterium]